MTIRVVIAEDEAIIRLDLRETLEEEGYDVVGETGRGDDAVSWCATCKPDLAILDIKMPGMDGLEAARVITAERICGVLMLTAFSQREVIEEARDAGALAYLVKPYQKSDLIPAIEVAIGRFREMQHLTGEVDALGEQLESRKIIDRAKGVLIDECGMKRGRGVHLHPAHRDERAVAHARGCRAGAGRHTAVREAAPARRQLADLPRLLRPADRHGHGRRAGDQRGVRVHVDVHLPVEGPQPDGVMVAFDRPEPTFRHEANPQYKAQREAAPDILRQQMGLVREVLDALRVTVVDLAGLRGRRHHRPRSPSRPRPTGTRSSSSPATATATSSSTTRA